MSKVKNIFLIWHQSQARVNSMEQDFDYKPFYIMSGIKKKKLILIDYLIKLSKTIQILFRHKPHTVWVQIPPSVILFAVYIYKLFYPNTVVVSDCHNGQFRDPWLNFPFAKKIINKCSNLIIVHNEDIYQQVLSMKILDESKIFILEDNLPDPDLNNERVILDTDREIVLFPASFKDDEPVQELLNAAKQIPDTDILITGNISGEKLRKHSLTENDIPSNVKFTGWVSNEEYKDLVVKADLMLGLTLYDYIQLSVAVEGVGYEKAMVLSNTNTLRKLFSKGTIFVDNNANDIAKGIKEGLANKKELEEQMKLFKKEKKDNWKEKARGIKEIIDSI
ncbi:glycosyltransferase [Sediminibacillus massiliensis]|uniref:glycosyltransferase n=1 Tax=Sediminibacillus massiliensis TaxID=1926277 RepID=UPI00098883E6|nr:glycosyltransferase [Sediminibacillus massiliensis]